MAPSIAERIRSAWNVFVTNDEKFRIHSWDMGASYGRRPDRTRLNASSERSIVASIYTRIGVDVASETLMHVRLDENKRYVEDMESSLNECLTVEANKDQAGRAFRQDIAMTLIDKGVIAIVPVDTSINPEKSGGYDIKTMRVGEVVAWYPDHVRVSLWNDRVGRKEEITLQKRHVAVIENPLYAIMNEPNSTLQRLIRKLNMLDAIDEQSSSGKLDIIIQLPYVIKNERRKEQAENRRKDIEMQLQGSKYGIAYTEATERITQLNRPSENNLLTQVTYLTNLLYGQLGLTESVMNGTASEAEMLNYYRRTIEPLLGAIAEGMKRSFLTKTARSQGQSIEVVRDPFKLVPASAMAELADKFTRNEILSSNEMRSIIGFKPSNDPKAEELRNKNLPVVVEENPEEEADPDKVPGST